MGNRYFINGDTLTGIADSIREKTGKTATIKPTEMADEIASISGGGEFPDTALEALGHYTSSPDIDSAYYYSANSWHKADSDDNALVFYDENHWRRPNYAEFLYLDIDTMAWTTVITPEAFLNGITDRGTPLIDTDKIFQYVDDEWVQVEYNDDVTVPTVDFSKLILNPYLNGTVFSSTPSSVNIPTLPELVFKPGSKSWEMQFKFRQTATSTYATIIGTAKSSQPYNIIIEIKSGKVMCYICNKATPNTDDVYLTGKTTIELNKWYWVNVTRVGNRFTMLLSENGEGFTVESTQASSIEVNENGYDYTLFCCWDSNRFYGDIDLDASYIIVDGVKTWGITKENTALETMLPDGYTRVACLESTSTQYIKTGIIAQYGLTTTATVCSRVMTDNYDTPVLSARSDNGKVRVYNLFLCNGICYGDGTSYSVYSGSLQKRVTKIETTLNETDIVIKFDNESPVTKTFTSMGEIQDNLELYMFASNYQGAQYINQLQIFELEISKDGTKLAHYIPCLDTEGVPCMYDLVTKTTKYNAGTGQFGYQMLTETTTYKSDVVYNGKLVLEAMYSDPTDNANQPLAIYNTPVNTEYIELSDNNRLVTFKKKGIAKLNCKFGNANNTSSNQGTVQVILNDVVIDTIQTYTNKEYRAYEWDIKAGDVLRFFKYGNVGWTTIEYVDITFYEQKVDEYDYYEGEIVEDCWYGVMQPISVSNDTDTTYYCSSTSVYNSSTKSDMLQIDTETETPKAGTVSIKASSKILNRVRILSSTVPVTDRVASSCQVIAFNSLSEYVDTITIDINSQHRYVYVQSYGGYTTKPEGTVTAKYIVMKGNS